ncbi:MULTISPECIES: tyrosine-type recombinase/integrase [unclassified Acinetobacter]|uniref:tyrosine-type recombinase/integrase n=1 Tax=unclassified Acinetobacter TaxID=196816 RepID=UPI0015D2F148|nr:MULTISPECIES: tyrosine-type recombinase/integrase [unclassified Acinetobacter]
MASNKLTDAKIKILKPQEKVYRILDSDRLYIEVRPSGTKVWRFKFTHQGKESSMSLGEYPSIGLADARILREEMRAKLARGVHPVLERKQLKLEEESKLTNTFKNVALEYYAERLSSKTENYKNQFSVSMEKDVFPAIGSKDIKAVTSADVLGILKNTIKRVRSQKNRGTGEVTAIQNRKFIGAVMRYAIATLRAENDPTYAVRDVVIRPEVTHARPLNKDERIKIRTRLETYGGTETVKNAGLMLLYTMLRTIEIRRMEWSWVDFDDRIVTFPKSAMKKSREHILPMSEQVYAILKNQYLNSGNKVYVFPSVYKSDSMLNQMTLNRMFQHLAIEDVSAHDLRATASTLLNEYGYDDKWIEAQLAHADDNKTRASYNHAKYLADRRKMMQDWADMVDGWKQ